MTTPRRKGGFTPRTSSTPHQPLPLQQHRSRQSLPPVRKKFAKMLSPPREEGVEGEREGEEREGEGGAGEGVREVEVEDWGVGDDVWEGETDVAMETDKPVEECKEEEKEPEVQV